MKKTLLDILCCPVCKGKLTLQTTKEEHDEVVTGSLSCITCKTVYPVSEGIPDLLPREPLKV